VACTLYFCVMIARDMLHPERDPVPPDLAPPSPSPVAGADPTPWLAPDPRSIRTPTSVGSAILRPPICRSNSWELP
jgi:hypothetical protein